MLPLEKRQELHTRFDEFLAQDEELARLKEAARRESEKPSDRRRLLSISAYITRLQQLRQEFADNVKMEEAL